MRRAEPEDGPEADAAEGDLAEPAGPPPPPTLLFTLPVVPPQRYSLPTELVQDTQVPPPPGSPSWAGSLSLHPCHEVRLRGLFLRFIKLPVLKNPTSHPISGGQFLNLEGGRVFFTETPVRGRNLGHFGSDPPPNPSNHPTPSACLLLPPLQPSKPYPTALQGWLGESRVKTRKQVQNHRKHGKHGK